MKKAKSILPALAFVVAAVASLATVSAKETLATQDASLPSPSSCAKIGTCTIGGTSFCNNGTQDVVIYNANGTCGLRFNGTFN